MAVKLAVADSGPTARLRSSWLLRALQVLGLALLVDLVVAVCVVRWAVQFPDLLRSSPMADYMTFYVGAEMLRDGEAHKLYDVEAQRQVGSPTPYLANTPATFYNQPLVAVLFLPETLLSLRHGFLLWTFISVGMIGASVWLLFRMIPAVPSKVKLLIAAGLVASYPLQHLLYLGQLVPITMLSLAAGLWYLRQSRVDVGGRWLALQLLKYPFAPGVLVYLVAAGYWRSVKTMALVGAATLAIGLALVGPAGLVDNVRLVMKTTTDGASTYGTSIGGMMNWRGFSAVALGDTGGPLYFGGIVATCLFTLATALRVWRRCGPRSAEGMAACVLLSYMLAQQVHYQDVLIVYMALALVCEAACARGQVRLAVGLCAFWLFWFGGGLPYSLYYLSVFPLLALTGLLWHLASIPAVTVPTAKVDISAIESQQAVTLLPVT